MAWACRNARARHVHPNRAWAMQGGSAYASEQGLDDAGMLAQGILVPMWSHGGGPNVVPRGWSQCGPTGVAPMWSHLRSQWWNSAWARAGHLHMDLRHLSGPRGWHGHAGMLGRGMCIRTGPGRCREALPMHLNRDWTMQECSRKASVVPRWSHGGWSQCGPTGVVPMWSQVA